MAGSNGRGQRSVTSRAAELQGTMRRGPETCMLTGIRDADEFERTLAGVDLLKTA